MRILLTIITIIVFSLTTFAQDQVNIRPVPNSVKINKATEFLEAQFYIYDLDVTVPPERDLSFFQTQLDNPDNKFNESRTAAGLKAQYDNFRQRQIDRAEAEKNKISVSNLPPRLPLERLDIDLDQDQLLVNLWLTVQVLGDQVIELRARVQALEAQ